MVFDNKFEAHALHDKQVIKMPVTNKNRKLFLGRHNITAKPKTVPKEALVITETRTGLRLVVCALLLLYQSEVQASWG